MSVLLSICKLLINTMEYLVLNYKWMVERLTESVDLLSVV